MPVGADRQELGEPLHGAEHDDVERFGHEVSRQEPIQFGRDRANCPRQILTEDRAGEAQKNWSGSQPRQVSP